MKNRRQESEDDVVLFANEVTQTGYGVGLSSAVAAAVPNVVGAVIAEIGRRPFGWHQGSKCPGSRASR
jgi:hydrogenase maturation protease